MRGKNAWEGRGNLTRDPDIKYSEGGTAIGKLSMAINESYFDKKTNTQREDVQFIDITVFGKTAEVCGQHLKKGSPLIVEGKLRFETWDDKQTGQKRSQLKVIGNDVCFLEFGGKNNQPGQ